MHLKLFFIIITFFFTSATYAAASDDLTQLLNNTRSMQANFTQVVKDTKGRSINNSRGQMALERPGKFRWQTMQPNAQLIVTNGKRVWIYDKDLEQLTIRNLTKETGETPALLLSNTNTALDKDFVVQAINDGSAINWFVLRPKDKSSLFSLIKLGFKNNQITHMQLQDHLGQTTIIQFSHVVTNPGLSTNTFIFSPPKNVDVIDETRH